MGDIKGAAELFREARDKRAEADRLQSTNPRQANKLRREADETAVLAEIALLTDITDADS